MVISRLPIEVIQHGLYSKESDIYMLGMTIWEIYTALDLYKYKHNRTGCPLEGKPFATIPKNEVIILENIKNISAPDEYFCNLHLQWC